MPRKDDPLKAQIKPAGLTQADIAIDLGEHVSALNAMLCGSRPWKAGLRDKVRRTIEQATT